MSNDLCSIIVPIYNGADYLAETIESFIDQDYENKELVLVDDGSIDESYAIARDFGLRYPDCIKTFRNNENMGIVKTLFFGIDESKGGYISGVGHDDVMLTNRLSKLISCIENQKVSMVCSNAYFLLGDKKTTQLVRDNSQWSKSQYINKYDFLIQNPVVGSSAVFRKKAFEQIDKKIFQYKNFIEWIHWFQYTLLDGVYFISDPYLYYRKHPNNITNTIIGTKDYNEYKRFCRRYVLSNLKFVEIIKAMYKYSISQFQFRTGG